MEKKLQGCKETVMERPNFLERNDHREESSFVGQNNHRKPSDVKGIGTPRTQFVRRRFGILHHRERKSLRQFLCTVKGHHLGN